MLGYQLAALLYSLSCRLGAMPVMTRTRACHLAGLTRAQLVALKEEANEMGGYFVCNGIERLIRCLIAQRRCVEF
jgi:DNA-directed RNA polymerase I subunit RPA2